MERDGYYPAGWYQIAWSDELKPGDVKPLRYFAQDLVLYRGDAGTPHLLDAFCLHLGAHLGFGGHVVDDDIICPFHEWRWGSDGRNVGVPYSKMERHKGRSLRSWSVVEAHGILFVWYGAEGSAPDWDLHIEIPGSGVASESTRKTWSAVSVSGGCHPFLSTIIDCSRWTFLHGAVSAVLRSYQPDQHIFRTERSLVWPDGSEELETTALGAGLIVYRRGVALDSVIVFSFTPVIGETFDIFATILRCGSSSGDNDMLLSELDREVRVLSHSKYLANPSMLDVEAVSHNALIEWFNSHRIVQEGNFV